MITENKHRDNKQNHGGMENEVQQNRGMDQDYPDRDSDEQPKVDSGNPVDHGGVEETELDPGLEEQWLAVRDEYLAHYPDLDDSDTAYEKGSFYTVIDRLAKRKQSTPEEIQNEIMSWSATERG